MTDLEKYNLATSVLSLICKGLNDGLYRKIGGKVSIQWQTLQKVDAWADSRSNLTEPADHVIGIDYELIRQVYDDIDQYCTFIENNTDDALFELLFEKDDEVFELIRSDWSGSEVRENMFMGAITWVFFHELTHLLQEHGVVRGSVGSQSELLIHEFNINQDMSILRGRAACISHATELAADYGATVWCVTELIRQYCPSFDGNSDCDENLQKTLQLFVGGISCLFYRFYGKAPSFFESQPSGAHPHPIVRLETTVPIIYELLTDNNSAERKNLVFRFSQTSTSVGVFWLKYIYNSSIRPELLFLEGTVNRDGGREYLTEIVNVWDEIKPLILNNQRWSSDLYLLGFSDVHRSMIFEGLQIIEKEKGDATH